MIHVRNIIHFWTYTAYPNWSFFLFTSIFLILYLWRKIQIWNRKKVFFLIQRNKSEALNSFWYFVLAFVPNFQLSIFYTGAHRHKHRGGWGDGFATPSMFITHHHFTAKKPWILYKIIRTKVPLQLKKSPSPGVQSLWSACMTSAYSFYLVVVCFEFFMCILSIFSSTLLKIQNNLFCKRTENIKTNIFTYFLCSVHNF